MEKILIYIKIGKMVNHPQCSSFVLLLNTYTYQLDSYGLLYNPVRDNHSLFLFHR